MPLIAATQPVRFSEFEGELVVITPHKELTLTTTRKEPPEEYQVIICTVVVVSGPHAGNEFHDMHISQARLLGLLRQHVGTGDQVVGVLRRTPTGNRPFYLDNPTKAQMEQAADTCDYLNSLDTPA